MKYGMVTQIRINPEDCQSILDLMGVLGIDPYDGRSFAQCVSLALSSSLGAYRKAGTLPQVDAFQYLNRMGPFLESGNNKKKARMADMMAQHILKGGVPIAPALRDVPNPGQYMPEHLRPSVVGYTEGGSTNDANVPLLLDDATKEMLAEELALLYRRENEGETLTAAEKDRYNYLNKVLFT